MSRRSPVILTALLLAPTLAMAGSWTVVSGSEVVFTSKAPMESFDGHTDQVTGHLNCNTADRTTSVDLRFAVDLASLDTGIGLRNRHMRENHLETDSFPEAVFSGGTVVSGDPRDLRPGSMVALEVAGIFELHGVSREMVVPADVTMAADSSLTITAHFTVKLSDHDIERPKFLVMKLADAQTVAVSLTMQRQGTP